MQYYLLSECKRGGGRGREREREKERGSASAGELNRQ